MKKKALFGRKIFDLEELKEFTYNYGGGDWWGYEIIREIKFGRKEFEEFTRNFLLDREWINEDDGGTRNGIARCIRIINEETGEKLLINNEGYKYARYIALEE